MRITARFLLFAFLVTAAPVVGARPVHASEVRATTDLSWLRVASYLGKRMGPSIIALVGEIIDACSGPCPASPPPPPPDEDPPVSDPDYTP